MDGWHTLTASEMAELPFTDCDDPKEIEQRHMQNEEALDWWERWLERQTR